MKEEGDTGWILQHSSLSCSEILCEAMFHAWGATSKEGPHILEKYDLPHGDYRNRQQSVPGVRGPTSIGQWHFRGVQPGQPSYNPLNEAPHTPTAL
jgi:hypothetical protein